MIKKTVYVIIATCFFMHHVQAVVVSGDAAGDTFSFEVGHAVFVQSENEGSRLWLASGETITSEDSKKYALSFVQQIGPEPLFNVATGQQLVPTATPMGNEGSATIYVVDGNQVRSTTESNPIFGAHFSFFGIFGVRPAFVVSTALNKLYLVHDLEHFENPVDNQVNKTELLLHNLGPGEETAALHVTSANIFVAHADGTFGDDMKTSKIAKFIPNAIEQDGKTVPFLQKIADKVVDKDVEALRGGTSPLDSIGSSVTFHTFAGTTYSGLHTTATDAMGINIATGAMIVTTTSEGLEFNKIVDDAALSSTKNTIISTIDSSSIRIKNIATLSTSTSLNYLIVARDSGMGPQSIYAAPLVSETGTNFGRLADATKITNKFYGTGGRFHQRVFDTPLTDPTQINIDDMTDFTEQITVGGAIPLAAGDIKQLYTVGDTVYIVIGDDYAAGTKPGTFCSQAIFAQDGHIISWTPWARVLGTDEPMNFSHTSPNTTSNFYISDAGNGFKKVVLTQWNTMHNLSTFLKTAFFEQSGTQGLFNFPASTPGFDSSMSLLIGTGFNQVSIGQTGHNPGEFRIKTIGTGDIVSFNDVNNNRAFVAAELAHVVDTDPDNSLHWLFVGGSSGVAVLTDDANGYTHMGNFADVQDFNAGQNWKQVGDFSFVKKLIWDTTYLYVLTTNALYRIALNADKFKNPATAGLDVETILISTDLSQSPGFLDLIIDNNFCILGTTNGIYSFNVSSGKATPTRITIPDGLPAVPQLFVASSQAEPQRNFKTKSNLYVLNNTFGSQQARLNRFVIQDSVVTPFNDALLSSVANPTGEATSLIRFNQYVSNYFTNGSWNFASNYFLGTTQPAGTISPGILQLAAYIKNGKSSSHIILPVQSSQVPINFLRDINNFLGIMRESTSGALIASGNFEARVNA